MAKKLLLYLATLFEYKLYWGRGSERAAAYTQQKMAQEPPSRDRSGADVWDIRKPIRRKLEVT